MEWRTIDSAPRDGRVIIVADADAGCFAMQWGHIQRNELFSPGTVGMWVASDGSFTWTESDGLGPSHWIPEDEYTPETAWPPSKPEWK